MATEKIGRYEILSEMGRGGMATVYLARDPSFARQVAVKVLPPEFTHNPEFRKRFEREAQLIAALEHPAIVPVHDFGQEGDQPYIVMRYMPGGTLADRIGGKPMPIDEIVPIFQRLAEALDEAHSQNIVHRDLKPSNVLFDGRGQAFLSDFGMAKLLQDSSTLTTTGGVVGTAAYMSPEQATGEAQVDKRSDVYSLGVILYEMLTGHHPYEADTPIMLILKHVLDPVPQLEVERLGLLGLSQAWNEILAHVLAKDPKERYQSAGALADALNMLVASEGEPRLEKTPLLPTSPLLDEVSPPPPARPPFNWADITFPPRLPGWLFQLLKVVGWIVVIVGLVAGLAGILPFVGRGIVAVVTTLGAIYVQTSSWAQGFFTYGWPYIAGGLAVIVVVAGILYAQRRFGQRILRAKHGRHFVSSPQTAGDMTVNLIAALRPRKPPEIINLIGRDQELRLKDAIVHFGAVRCLLRGFGHFGATSLIGEIVRGMKAELPNPENSGGRGVVMTVQLDFSNIRESDDAILALLREFRFEASRGNYDVSATRKLTRKLNRFQLRAKDVAELSKEDTVSIKVAPIPGIEASFLRKTNRPTTSQREKAAEEELFDLIPLQIL